MGAGRGVTRTVAVIPARWASVGGKDELNTWDWRIRMHW